MVTIDVVDFKNAPIPWAQVEIIDTTTWAVVASSYYGSVSFAPEPYKKYSVRASSNKYVPYTNTLTFPAHDLNLSISLREVACESGYMAPTITLPYPPPPPGEPVCCNVNYYIVDDLCTGAKIFYNLSSGNNMSVKFSHGGEEIELEGDIIYIDSYYSDIEEVTVVSSYIGQGCCCDTPAFTCSEEEVQPVVFDPYYIRLSTNVVRVDSQCPEVDSYTPYINHYNKSYYYKEFFYLKKGGVVNLSGTIVDIPLTLKLASSPEYVYIPPITPA